MRPAFRTTRPTTRPTSRPTNYAAILALFAGVGVPAGAAATTAAEEMPTVEVAPVTFVDPGSAAAVRVRLTDAASSAVTLRWTVDNAGVVARPTATSGSVTFPAGATAGSERTVRVPTAATTTPGPASTMALRLSGVRTTGAAPRVVVNAQGLPYLDESLPVRARVEDLLARMTLEEKVGQMTQAERMSVDADPSLIATWRLGSLLSGGGSTPKENTPQAWADMVDAYQAEALSTRLQIPMIYGIDSVHGHGNLQGATLIPHNVGLGATRDAGLVRDAEQMVATETRATGIPWVFAPCLCVARDDRWGRTYESFGEHPSLATRLGGAAINGFQGNGTTDLADPDRVLATAKHFAADGDTEYGSGRNSEGANSSDYPIDQGITRQSRRHIEKVSLAPYWPAVRTHRVGSVMPSYSSIDLTDDGLGNPVKMHANKALLQGWLKDRAGFDGFVISDYNGLDQIPLPTYGEKVAAWV
ncbi:MAG: glycoside hydrolase family 3 protein, partial [Dermatophilaceae bacterium]